MSYPTDPEAGEIYKKKHWWDKEIGAWRKFDQFVFVQDEDDVITGVPINVQTFTTPGTHEWEKPSSISGNPLVFIRGIGGGGSGAAVRIESGNRVAATGGYGGEFYQEYVSFDDLEDTEEIIVGSGGDSVETLNENNNEGVSGEDGEDSSFMGNTARGGDGGSYDISDTASFNPSINSSSEDLFSGNYTGGDDLNPPGSVDVSDSTAGVDDAPSTKYSAGGGGSVGYRDDLEGNKTGKGGKSIYAGNGGDSIAQESDSQDTLESEGGYYPSGGGSACLIWNSENNSGQKAISGKGANGWVQVIILESEELFDPKMDF